METIESLRDRLEALENQTHALADQTRAAERRLRWWRILACSSVVLGLVILPLAGGTAQEQSWYERTVARRLAALEYKLQYITGGPNEVVITKANLRIVNGLGETGTTNGLGNLIVGYNELRSFPENPSVHTGSHNVVVGRRNNFSSFGGLVVGESSEISNEFSSVSGGIANTASGLFSSVSGGLRNTAAGEFASVSGGAVNEATGRGSSISGGFGNLADGQATSVGGGLENTASGLGGASVSGGRQNTASGDSSSVSGGFQRTAPGQNNWAAGPLFAAQ